jgi:microcystin-dependent protein
MTSGQKPQEFYRDQYGVHPVFPLSAIAAPGDVVAEIGADEIKDTHIDWGTGAGQVSAVDLPIADAGSRYTGTEVETALQELAGSGRTTETVKANADAIVVKGVPTGAILMWGTASPPTGWLTCDGTAISETTDAALFAVIGHGFGGDPGGGNFYLPNFKGISPAGVGTQTINTRDKAGPTLGQVREDQFQGHKHLSGVAPHYAGSRYGADVGSQPLANISQESGQNTNAWRSSTPYDDSTNGTPRTEAYTHGPEIGIHFIIKT